MYKTNQEIIGNKQSRVVNGGIKLKRLSQVENRIIVNYLNARVVMKKVNMIKRTHKEDQLQDAKQEKSIYSKQISQLTPKIKIPFNTPFNHQQKGSLKEKTLSHKHNKKKEQQYSQRYQQNKITKKIKRKKKNTQSYSLPPLNNSIISKSMPHPLLNPQQYKQSMTPTPNLNNIVVNNPKQWCIIDPLSLQTQFYILQKATPPPSSQLPYIPNTLITLPSRQSLPQFIKDYTPILDMIYMPELIKDASFQIHYVKEEQLYFGHTVNNLRHGLGVYVSHATIIEGKWQMDQIVSGRQKTVYGVYTGAFKNGLKHGEGEFEWVNGQFYSGEWVEGKKHGGGFWRSNKNDSYVGEWRNNEVEGQGVHITHTKQKYEGQFKQFLKHGWGKETFSNGDVYQGVYSMGKPHGKGCYKWKGGIMYEGIFREGLRHGKGCIRTSEGVYYNGQFNNECASGVGEITYSDGNSYVGEVINGKKHGRGVFRVLKRNEIYDGYWNEDEFSQK